MRILILGATGFIGTHLAAAAARRRHEVIALSRSGRIPDGGARAFAWSLGEPVPRNAYQQVSCAVHLAHDFGGEAGARRTIESTVAAVAQLRAGGVRRQLFFSSYSAGDHSTSLYGRSKLAIESELAGQPGVVIVRPGLVLGDGGIYGRIRRYARSLPVVPLPDGGRGKVPVIGIEALCAQTLDLATTPAPPAEANLFEPALKTLRELVLEAAAEIGHRPGILPIPASLLMWILARAGELRIPLPVNADSLAGFIANQAAAHLPTSKIEHP